MNSITANACPVCGAATRSQTANPGGRDATAYDCPRCGVFALSRTLIASLPQMLLEHPDGGAKLSHSIRCTQDQQEVILLNTHTAEAIVEHPLPRPREQADLLVRWLAQCISGPGETIGIGFDTHGSIIGSKSAAGFELVVDHLFASGLVTGYQSKTLGGGDQAEATLSFAGWDYYESLRVGAAVYRKAFMAMKFGDVQMTSVLEDVFKPSAKRAGFDLFKLDDRPIAGLIDDRLRVEIQSSDFLVADLSHDNLGAYWEAGYAEGLGKPVIYTCEKSKFAAMKTHFDTNHHLTIQWDADSPQAAGDALAATIRATLPHLARLTDVED